ncbi:MAG TPA: glycosyltransferase [Gaiellaceae bacterium]|jgi:glycosyltransferase involved in cell wall biosynthesis
MARSVHYFSDSRQRGGAEAALLLLLEHLDRTAWEPTLLYVPCEPLESVAEDARRLGVAVHPVPHVRELLRVLRRERPSVFHAHLSWPLAARKQLATAIVARVPAVVATYQLFPPGSFGRTTPLQGRLLACGVGRGIAVSDAIATALVERLGWPRRKIEVIRNSIPVDRYLGGRDPELRRELSGGSDDFVFLTVARLDAQKGLDVLLRAAASVDGARFVIAGGGVERDRLEQEAAALGVSERVVFLGPRNDVGALLAAADAFVLPSLFEGTPLALLEAMAAKKPIVATAIAGVEELVTANESALLVAPGDPDALAAASQRIVAEPELRQSLAASARRRVETEFAVDASTLRVMSVYDELLR